jgi:hypothetical protein
MIYRIVCAFALGAAGSSKSREPCRPTITLSNPQTGGIKPTATEHYLRNLLECPSEFFRMVIKKKKIIKIPEKRITRNFNTAGSEASVGWRVMKRRGS